MDLAEIDLSNPDHFVAGTPHAWFRALRAQDPVHWQPEADGSGFWCITKYDDLKLVSRQPGLFSSAVAARALERVRMIMLNMDPPNHVKFRRIVQRGFTPRRVAQQEAHIRELARRIVDVVAPRGESEFVEELAFGIGERYCLGANLARLELHVVFEELTGRLRRPRLLAPPRRLRSNFINGGKEMRVAFDPAPVRA